MLTNTAKQLIHDVKGNLLDPAKLANKAVELAGFILKESQQQQNLKERYHAWKLSRMMDDPYGKAFILAMTDQVFRPITDSRSADQMRYLIDEYGIPACLPLHEQVAMRLGALASKVVPGVVMPAVTEKMRAESSQVILPGEDKKLKSHLKKRKRQRTRMNINQLGEAILGEEEAGHRLQQVINRLESPDCEYISVKISAIFSQINLVAYDATVNAIKERLRKIYRAAEANLFKSDDGEMRAKFVNLDMEEYRDLHLTCDAFMGVLDESEFTNFRAGIVLQAYLPDTHLVQQKLTDWARVRVSKGGAPIKIRIVKGANLAMENVDATLHGWELAPYSSKLEVDANFKRMCHYGCQPENAKVARLGVASHNLFDISYVLLLRSMMEVNEYVEFEMLEGMASHQSRAVQEIADGLLCYAPVVNKEDFHSAISYLVRRLDENSQEENFLHDLFGMKSGDFRWDKQKSKFLAACELKDTVKCAANRTQNRTTETYVVADDAKFENCPDTDWSLRHNQQWIEREIAAFKQREITTIPLQIGGDAVVKNPVGVGIDPSTNQQVYSYSLADASDVQRALDAADQARPGWEAKGLTERARLLREAAVEMARKRGESIAAMVMDAGKAASEGDAEVSEAIDFANYYAESLSKDGILDGTEFKALGTVVITPPWNFPYAIPCGGVLAALMAGNTVIMKPAPEAVLTAWVMVNHLWNAGIPKDVLQFLPCPDNEVGKSLVASERVGAVVLTGAYETGRMFQSWKADIRLYAETSGKNSLIITNAADPDQAIKDLIKGSFNHAGQKCSASSLAIIEGDLYDDPAFRRQLKDAASSLKVGQSWDPASIVTPVMLEPDERLLRALTVLDEGEEWLLQPQMLEGNPRLWSPGIKLGVKQGSWYHKTECFGPVLGLIRADDLKHAIEIQNDSHFGLTGGIHSLDPRETKLWRESVEVGNAYINRPITGAIVQRQPFGGWKKSCFGPGAKAGGPNYVSLFATWSQTQLPTHTATPRSTIAAMVAQLNQLMPESKELIEAAAGSYEYWWANEFSIEHDPTGMYCETNHFRYVPLRKVLLRADGLSDAELASSLLAASTVNVTCDVSLSEARPWLAKFSTVSVTVETGDALAARLQNNAVGYSSLRAPSASESLRRAANDAGLQLIDWDILVNGRLELMHFFHEQAISECTHRYGNVIPKPEELDKQFGN